MTIVEIIARAICKAEGYGPDDGDAVCDAHWKEYTKHAQEAVKSLGRHGYDIEYAYTQFIGTTE